MHAPHIHTVTDVYKTEGLSGGYQLMLRHHASAGATIVLLATHFFETAFCEDVEYTHAPVHEHVLVMLVTLVS
jgi:hypothetical protein